MCHSSNKPSLPCNYTQFGSASLTTTGWTPRFYKMLHKTYATTHPWRSGDGGEVIAFLASLCWPLHSQGRKSHYQMLCSLELTVEFSELEFSLKNKVWGVFADKMVTWGRNVILLNKSEGALNSRLHVAPWVSCLHLSRFWPWLY